MDNPSWERLEQVIESSGLSANDFARTISLKPAENLLRIRQGENRIGFDLARRIHACYPEYSVAWLMTGQESELDNLFPEPDTGYPYANQNVASGLHIAAIPFYRSLVGRDINKPMIPDCCLHLTEFLCNGALLATVYRGSHLYPLLPGNCIVLLKPCDPDGFAEGRLYYIETRCLRVFRIVRCVDEPSRLILTTPAGDCDLEVERGQITASMEVVGVVSRWGGRE